LLDSSTITLVLLEKCIGGLQKVNLLKTSTRSFQSYYFCVDFLKVDHFSGYRLLLPILCESTRKIFWQKCDNFSSYLPNNITGHLIKTTSLNITRVAQIPKPTGLITHGRTTWVVRMTSFPNDQATFSSVGPEETALEWNNQMLPMFSQFYTVIWLIASKFFDFRRETIRLQRVRSSVRQQVQLAASRGRALRQPQLPLSPVWQAVTDFFLFPVSVVLSLPCTVMRVG